MKVKFLQKALSGSIERVCNASYIVYNRFWSCSPLSKEEFLAKVREVLERNEA